MKKMVKQVVGIDVAKDELVVCAGLMSDNWIPEFSGVKTFANDEKGFSALLVWVKKLAAPDVSLRYVMEATGVYHEALAYYLNSKGLEISIVLPNKISAYMKRLDIKTLTDSTAAVAICRFGLERPLERWQKPRDVFKRLRQLSRERGQIVEERTMLKNQLHAESTEAEPNKGSVKRISKRIELLDKQEAEIKAELAALVREDEEVKALMVLLCSLPGVGLLTAAVIVAETNGFALIQSKRQLTSYAGLDIVEKQSGTSVRGKARISKRGNRYLRKALYMAALAALRSDERFKAVFARIAGRTGIRMKGAVAVQRRLPELSYTLFKTQKKYDKDFFRPRQEEQTTAAAEETVAGKAVVA